MFISPFDCSCLRTLLLFLSDVHLSSLNTQLHITHLNIWYQIFTGWATEIHKQMYIDYIALQFVTVQLVECHALPVVVESYLYYNNKNKTKQRQQKTIWFDLKIRSRNETEYKPTKMLQFFFLIIVCGQRLE